MGRVACFFNTLYDIESDVLFNTSSLQIPYDVVGVRGDRPDAPVHFFFLITKMSSKHCRLSISSERETAFTVEFVDFSNILEFRYEDK